MDTERRTWLKSVSIFFFAALLTAGMAACSGAGQTTPTTSPSPLIPVIPTNTPVILSSSPAAPTVTPTCTDNLTGIQDVTIPDNTVVAPGAILDKQWLVQNSGSCNWDNRYRLRLTSDVPLGASPEQALFPARAGTETVIRILFTAPLVEGEYKSVWQAFDPNGIPFGDPIFIKVVVQP